MKDICGSYPWHASTTGNGVVHKPCPSLDTCASQTDDTFKFSLLLPCLVVRTLTAMCLRGAWELREL